MQSKLELQADNQCGSQTIAVCGPRFGAVALIAPTLYGLYSGTVYESLEDCSGECAKSLAGTVRKILTHLVESLEPPPAVSPARGPPTNWGEFVQADDDVEIVQISPEELPAIDIHSL